MSLKNLKLAAASPLKPTDPTQRGRDKLLTYLAEQKAVAVAEAEGRTYTAKRIIRRRTESGDVVRAEAPRHVRRGWFKGADGSFYFQIRYGAKPLELGKGVNAVAVPAADQLPAILDHIIAAVHAGELDQAISAAAAERREQFQSRKKAP